MADNQRPLSQRLKGLQEAGMEFLVMTHWSRHMLGAM
jgi:hypothetical protein